MPTLNFSELPVNRSSNSSLGGHAEEAESFPSRVCKSLALAMLMLMSLTGNTMIIASVILNKNKRMRTVSNLLIVNTSVAYLLITLVNMTGMLYNTNSSRGFLASGSIGLHLCRLKNFAPFLSVTLSTQSFAILAVDRFIAVFYPIRRITHRTAYILITLSWMTSFGFGGVYLYGSVVITLSKTGRYWCAVHVIKTFNGLKGLVTFVWIEFSVFYIFPLALASILYSATIFRLWRPKLQRKSRGPCTIRYSDTTNKNAIKMLFTVLLLFAAAWLPLWVNTAICRGNLKHFLGHPICRSRVFAFLIYFMGYTHCAIAPFIYPIFSQNFRSGFKNCLSCSHCSCKNSAQRKNRNSTLELKAVSSRKSECRVTSISIEWKDERNA